MLATPFTFFRGSALMMALDLATTPASGIAVQLCGDAHLLNFGVFASPERRLLFDLNDFDETWPGPFEWDVKKLGASAILAARDGGMTPKQARTAATEGVRAYREWMHRYAEMTHLEVWYASLNAESLADLMSPSDRLLARKTINKATERTHHRAVAKLTEVVDGRRRIVPDPRWSRGWTGTRRWRPSCRG
jgi:uncharacterized protein (DUF2252 family)